MQLTKGSVRQRQALSTVDQNPRVPGSTPGASLFRPVSALTIDLDETAGARAGQARNASAECAAKLGRVGHSSGVRAVRISEVGACL